MSSTNAKWLFGAALVFAFGVMPVVNKYRSLFRPTDIYVLEIQSGKVWKLENHVRVASYEDPLELLFPWADEPMRVLDSLGFYMGKIVLPSQNSTCKPLWKKQVACIDDSRVEDEALYDLSFVGVQDAVAKASQRSDPVVVEVFKGLSKFGASELEENPVFEARAALIYSPDRKSTSSWSVVELGPSLVFQKRGAVFFERTVGIELPDFSPGRD